MATRTIPFGPGPAVAFPQRHPWDRAFFLCMLAMVWAAILSGFVYNNVKKYQAGELSYPWIVHFHAVLFVGWLCFFTAQVLFIRRGQAATHRRLGMYGAVLAGAMVIAGAATAILTERFKYGTPAADTRFLSVMFGDMLVFGGLVAGGIFTRTAPAAHKRIMLVATLLLTDAGFGRWLSPLIGQWMGEKNFWLIPTFAEGAWPFIRFQLLPMYLLVAAAVAYDWVSRRRVHPAYGAAIAWALPIHLLAGWLYFQPFWNSLALRIIGRP